MDKCFNSSVCNILKVAEKEMINCRHPYVGTEHLLLSLLKNSNIKSICYKFKLTYNSFKKELLSLIGSATKQSEQILYTPLLKIVIDKAYNKACDEHKDMDEFYLLSSLLSEQDGIALRVVDNMGVDIDGLVKELNKPSLIYELGVSLNDKAENDIYLREKELNEIMQILLRKNKNNPLLIGHSGVGKTAIVEQLAKRIKEGKVPDALKKYEIILINTSTLIAGTKYRGEFESRVNNLIKEVIKCKNIILFIDEVHTLVKTGASDGSIDAANILKPYLARGEIKIIGATTIDEYHNYIKKDTALTRRFTPVLINEPLINDMLIIMNKVKKSYESFYHLKIDKKVIKYIIEVCDKYLPNLYNPDKSIELLDTICSKKVLDNKNNIISIKDVDEVIKYRINMLDSKINISNLVNDLKQKYPLNIINNIVKIIQNNSVNKYLFINNYLDINREVITNIASKLNINLVKIDCLEYNDEYSLSRLIGSNYLYNILEENPYSFIVVNNYYCANKVIYNLINTMINSGYIVNSNNEKLNLNNTILFIFDKENKSKIGFNSNVVVNTN